MYPRKKIGLPSSNILVPLYVYPAPGAWDPLFTASVKSLLCTSCPLLTCVHRIACHPSLNFIIVVNPNNGPGSTSCPDANYAREIPRVNSYANVRTIGYVSTDYAKRSLSLVLQDIKVYSAWSDNANCPGLNMHGIFLDETISKYEPVSALYFETIASAVKSEAGLGNNPLVSFPCTLRSRTE